MTSRDLEGGYYWHVFGEKLAVGCACGLGCLVLRGCRGVAGTKWPIAPLVDAVSTRIVLTTQHEAAGTAVWALASCRAAVVDTGDEVDAAADSPQGRGVVISDITLNVRTYVRTTYSCSCQSDLCSAPLLAEVHIQSILSSSDL